MKTLLTFTFLLFFTSLSFSQNISEIDSKLKGLWTRNGQFGEDNIIFSQDNNSLLIEFGDTWDGVYEKNISYYDYELNYISNGIKGSFKTNLGKGEHPITKFTVIIINQDEIEYNYENGQPIKYTRKSSNSQKDALKYLYNHTGEYSRKNKIFESNYLGDKIKTILGSDYSKFLNSYGFDTPIKINEGILVFETGDGTLFDQYRQIIYVDIEKGLIYIAILDCNKVLEFNDGNVTRESNLKLQVFYNKITKLKLENISNKYCL